MAARWERQFQSVLPWIIERDHTYHLTPQTWPIITIITSVLKLGRALSDRPTKSNYDHCDVLIEQQHFLMNCFHLTLVWHPSPHGGVRPPHFKCIFIWVEHELCLSVSHQPSANRQHCANSGLLVVLFSLLLMHFRFCPLSGGLGLLRESLGLPSLFCFTLKILPMNFDTALTLQVQRSEEGSSCFLLVQIWKCCQQLQLTVRMKTRSEPELGRTNRDENWGMSDMQSWQTVTNSMTSTLLILCWN